MTAGDWMTVEPIWKGQPACLVGCGPSVSAAQVEAVRGKCKVAVINCAYQLAPWADLLYACDAKWWKHYQPEFAGMKVTQDPRVVDPDIQRILSIDEDGLSLDPSVIHQGANSGYQLLNLAVLLGANPILLLGYDFQYGPKREAHFHGSHPQPLVDPTEMLLAACARRFATTITDLRKAGVTVWNCSPRSALTAFRRGTIEEVLSDVCV